MKDGNYFCICIGMSIGLIFCYLLVLFLGDARSYRQGQLDALHGKWKYKLVTNQVEQVEEIGK